MNYLTRSGSRRNTVHKLTTHDAASVGGLSHTIFTPRPQGTRWCLTAISAAREIVNLGDFPNRGAALAAARSMAQACGGTAVP
jgi:hypothetical protein